MSNRRSPLRVPSVRGTVPLELAFRKDQEPDVGKSSLSTSVVFLAGSHERSPRSGGASGEFAPLSPRVDPGGGFKAESNRVARILLELLIETPIRAQGRGLRRASWPRARQASGPRQLWKTRMTVEVQKWARGT